MLKEHLDFDQLMQLYNHIGEEERHFNTLEMEYRKLASQWLLVSLGAIGFVLSKENAMPLNGWILVMGICLVASLGIFVLWLLDLKVYHELLHAAFKEGVLLEEEYKHLLPKIRTNMVLALEGGDIIKKVILFYFFSILVLLIIANIAAWMYPAHRFWLCIGFNVLSAITIGFLYGYMNKESDRKKLIDLVIRQRKVHSAEQLK